MARYYVANRKTGLLDCTKDGFIFSFESPKDAEERIAELLGGTPNYYMGNTRYAILKEVKFDKNGNEREVPYGPRL